jgi:hypothetical protein
MMRSMEQRRRAPQRAGHRTTLKVPDEVLDAARTLAVELGTTPNDAIVRLAEEGASARQRRLEAQRLAQQRRAAVAREGHDIDPDYPTGDALRSAMLGGREAS